MKFYKIETQAGQEIITNIKEDDIVECPIQSGLKEINAETVEKYNLKAGMKVIYIKSIENENGENAEIIENASFASCYIEDYIILDDLDDNCLYFDEYTDEIYTKNDIESWDAENYIWDHDGSNWRMTKIINSYNIELEEIDTESYNTGRIITYKTPNGNLIKIDYSFYQGSRDNVFEGDEFIEEEGE